MYVVEDSEYPNTRMARKAGGEKNSASVVFHARRLRRTFFQSMARSWEDERALSGAELAVDGGIVSSRGSGAMLGLGLQHCCVLLPSWVRGKYACSDIPLVELLRSCHSNTSNSDRPRRGPAVTPAAAYARLSYARLTLGISPVAVAAVENE